MADQIESAASPEVQAQAEAMGWIPASRYKGDPERFVDADAFIERGETVLPIVKAQNKKLQDQVSELTRNQIETKQALDRATKALEEIEERNTVATQKAVEQAIAQTKAALAQATTDGDHEAAAELTDKLVELRSAPAKVEKEEAKVLPKVEIDPEQKEWQDANTWFGTDQRRTALALGIAAEFRQAGDKSVGKVFLNKVKAEMLKTLGEDGGGESKVEGGRNGSEQETRTSGKKGYTSLPADAKAACDADAKRFVGEGKRYKDVTAWRNRYAELYFSEGA